MLPLEAVLIILAITVALGFVIARVEGLGFFLPKTTSRMNRSAQSFCSERCRTAEGQCPLTHSSEAAADCPLWKYVEADVPTVAYGSPFTS